MTSSTSVPLNLNDAVTISTPENTSSSNSLQGVVSYVGQVDFAPAISDYVGIRLTGASVGLGKNDGTVRGKRYFDAGRTPNSGLFLRYSSGKITKRKLTRLQELQLKRELGLTADVKKGGGSAVSAAGVSSSSTTTTPSRPSKIPPMDTSTPSSTLASSGRKSSASAASASGRISPTASATKNRLEALRAKREQAEKAAASSAVTASSSTPIPKTPGGTAGTSSSSSTRSRLEELRKERQRMTAGGGGGATTTSGGTTAAASSATASSVSRDIQEEEGETATTGVSQSSYDEARRKIDELDEQLQKQRSENSRLQAALEEKEQNVVDARKEMEHVAEERDGYKRELEEGRQQQQKEEGEQGTTSSSSPEEEKEEESTTAMTSDEKSTTDQAVEESPEAIKSERDALKTRLQDMTWNLTTLQGSYEKEKTEHASEIDTLQSELVEARTRAATAEQELSTLSTRESTKSNQTAAHLKERARLEGEVSSLHRRITELESSALDSDATLEELTLDKEQLTEEREALQEQLEESKLDAESAQVEVEELRLELEEARSKLESEREARGGEATSESGGGGAGGATGTTAEGGGSSSADAEDVARALSTQNARLREALVRLREQSGYEKMELSRQLRSAERESAVADELRSEVETLRSSKSQLEEEVRELKDMVDAQGSYEGMVEDLTDRITSLEDDNIRLQNAVADMEEASELAAEMEEVQAEENRSLMRDVENRDGMIRNLERAVEMQRRREAEFQKTVGNYRSVIDKLKQEKASLLSLQEGGEGEKSHLLGTAQRALAQAAQLVSDQAASRKREAEAAFYRVHAKAVNILSARLESLLPDEPFVKSEIVAIRSDVLLSKVAAKASTSLAGIATAFRKEIDAARSLEVTSAIVEESGTEPPPLTLPDSAAQQVGTMIHQTKFASLAVESHADALKLLCLAQWPGVLSMGETLDLASAVMHPFAELDVALTAPLRTLMEEGGLSPHRSSLVALEESLGNAKSGLFSGEAVVPASWDPPGWTIVRDVSLAKFECLGASAALAAAVSPSEDGGHPTQVAEALVRELRGLMGKTDQITRESAKVTSRLAALPLVGDEDALAGIAEAASAWKGESNKFFGRVSSIFEGDELDRDAMSEAEKLATSTLAQLLDLSAALKGAKVNLDDKDSVHPLSPEASGVWESVVEFIGKSIGDREGNELNCHVRARSVENKIATAIGNEPKLALVTTKVQSLEKNLSTRAKEIAMQNARLAELEALLATSSEQDDSGGSEKKDTVKSPSKSEVSSEAVASLTEENSFLHEAMEVLQAQVHEYEAEIRTLKEEPRGGKSFRRPKPKPAAVDFDLNALLGGGKDASSDSPSQAGGGASSALDASLLRPALASARADAATWRAKAISKSLASLPPLSVPDIGSNISGPMSGQPQDGDDRGNDANYLHSIRHQLDRCRDELLVASAQCRLTKASVSVVDLRKTACGRRPTRRYQSTVAASRIELREQRKKEEVAAARLSEASAAARLWLTRSNAGAGVVTAPQTTQSAAKNLSLVGKVTMPRSGTQGESKVVSLVVGRKELDELHAAMLQ